jgi:hypothetical protein
MTSIKYKKATVNLAYFEEPTLENCYWAGFIAADGCIDKNYGALRIRLKATERRHLERFLGCTCYTGKIYECKVTLNGKIYNQIQICISTNWKWAHDLDRIWSIGHNKSYNLLPPKLIDPVLCKAFIIGYIDGDGSIQIIDRRRRHPHKVIRFVGTQLFLKWIKEFCEQTYPGKGFGTTVTKSKRGNYYNYTVTGLGADKMFEDLSQLELPKLSRKWNETKLTIIRTGY